MTAATRESFPGRIEADSDLARALGIFVARWSLAEFSLIMPFIAAAKSTQEVAATTLAATSSGEAKIRVVQKLVANSTLPDERKATIKRALNGMLVLCEERNSIMHHLWVTESGGDISTLDHREVAGSERFRRQRTVADLNALSNRSIAAAHEVCAASGSPWVNAETEKLLHL